MTNSAVQNFAQVGIDRVTVTEEMLVAHVDVMTRSSRHAAALAKAFRIQPFRFARENETLHAFPRVPAVPARQWLEAHGLPFAVTSDKLRGDGRETWVQAGFPPSPLKPT